MKCNLLFELWTFLRLLPYRAAFTGTDTISTNPRLVSLWEVRAPGRFLLHLHQRDRKPMTTLSVACVQSLQLRRAKAPHKAQPIPTGNWATMRVHINGIWHA